MLKNEHFCLQNAQKCSKMSIFAFKTLKNAPKWAFLPWKRSKMLQNEHFCLQNAQKCFKLSIFAFKTLKNASKWAFLPPIGPRWSFFHKKKILTPLYEKRPNFKNSMKKSIFFFEKKFLGHFSKKTHKSENGPSQLGPGEFFFHKFFFDPIIWKTAKF